MTRIYSNIYIALGILAILLAILSNRFNPLALIWLLVPLIFSNYFLFSILPGTFRSIRIYTGAPYRKPRDVSHEQRSIPDTATDIAITLETLDFKRFGEVAVDLPGKPDITEWVFTGPDKIIMAELLVIESDNFHTPFKFVQFVTICGDENWVETSYPVGDNIDIPGFRSTYSDQSLEHALQTHQRELNEFQKIHGTPRAIDGMQTYLHGSQVYRQKYVQLKLRPSMIRGFILTSFSALATLWLAALAVLFNSNWSNYKVVFLLLLIGILLFIGSRILLARPQIKFFQTIVRDNPFLRIRE